MIRTFLLIACLLTSVACRQRGGTPADANIVANAGNHSAETIRPDTVARPPLAFGHETWDFGTIPETGGPVVHVFRFTNSGTKPVVVERVGVTCGCMKPTFSQAPVLPGGSGEIGIAYDPADRPGAFDKAVYVYTDGSRMMPLRIRGSVAARPETAADRFPVEFGGGIRLSVKEVNFRMVEQRHDRRLTLRCLNTSPYEVRLRAQFGQVTDTGSAHHDRPFEPPSGNGQITRINERSPHLGSGQVTDESDLSLRTGRQYGRSFGPQKGKRFSEFRPQPHLVR